VNELRRQGLEVHTATSPFKAGSVNVAVGDYVIRGDQPYRTLADMYFSVQSFSPANPRPYDDTGWTFQFMRNIVIKPVTEKPVFGRMTMLTGDARAAGLIDGAGPVLVVEHTTDNSLVTFRFKHPNVRMLAAEEDFELHGRTLRAGAFIIPNADRGALQPSVEALGLSAWAVASVPAVKTHDLDVPRIGYVHSWANTQNEGWVRAAFDRFGLPYTYFGDITLRQGNLRQKFDVIVYPHVGGSAQAQVNGIAMTGTAPLPYRKTEATPNLGAQDEADDIRGGMGWEGLMELVKFVQQGGTLITEGSTARIFPEYNISSGVTVESPAGLFVRGSIIRGIFADRRSPIAYGYDAQVPVYFNQDPVLSVGAGGVALGGGRGDAAPITGVGMNITPMASAPQQRLSVWDPDGADTPSEPSRGAGRARGAGAGAIAESGRGGSAGAEPRPRVILQFPSNPDEMLLSGTLVGGEALAGRAQIVDIPIGEGHVVAFAIRPFWRWQTHGTFFLGFNAILNWNDLDAGRSVPPSQ
jgi:hypothetical protein